MSISRVSSMSVYLLSFILLLQAVFGDIHRCLTPENSTANEVYGTNLKELSSYLAYEIPHTGFALGTKGQGEDKTYGLAMCRGNLSEEICKNCVANVTNGTRTSCPYSKGAFWWSEYCLVKYLDKDFFGQIDHETWYYIRNESNVSRPSPSFSERRENWLSQLVEQASADQQMFATGALELGYGKKKLYGSVQCCRDLSSADCKKCLHESIAFLPQCCNASAGARTESASCALRYEFYKFYNA